VHRKTDGFISRTSELKITDSKTQTA